MDIRPAEAATSSADVNGVVPFRGVEGAELYVAVTAGGLGGEGCGFDYFAGFLGKDVNSDGAGGGAAGEDVVEGVGALDGAAGGGEVGGAGGEFLGSGGG